MNAYDDAVSRTAGSCTIDLGLLSICAEPFPKAAHAAAALLTCLVGWQEYVIRHDLNVHDDQCWVFMADTDWEHYCGISRGQASRFMARFEELGWVESVQQARAAGRTKRAVTWYRLIPEAFPSSARSRAVPGLSSARSRAAEAREVARHPDPLPLSSKSLTSEPKKRVAADELGCWEPTAELWEWTSKTNPRVGRADLEQFRDHHAAKGTRIVDINATWRTWVRNTVRWGAVGDGGARRARLDNSFDDVAAAFLAQEQARSTPTLELGS